MDDGAVAARALAEAAAVIARGERAELRVDEGHELLRQVVGIAADGRGVDVLVAAERGEAVREDDDRGIHLLLVDEPRRPLGDVLAEPLPAGVARAAAHESDEVEEDRKAALGELLRVVLRRQPDVKRTHERIAEGIAPQHVRRMRQDGDAAGRARRVFGRHDLSRDAAQR